MVSATAQSSPRRVYPVLRRVSDRVASILHDRRAAATAIVALTAIACAVPYRDRMLLGALAALLGSALDGTRGALASAGIVVAGVNACALLTQGRPSGDWLFAAAVLGVLSVAFGQVVGRSRTPSHAREPEPARKPYESYDHLVNLMREGLVVVDLDENIKFANDAFAQMLGYLPGELVGKNLSELTTPEQFEVYRQKTRERREGRSDRYEARLLRKDGSQVEVLVSGTPFTTSDGAVDGVIAVFWDITERKREEERLKYVSLHDALTGVYNRAFFEQEMERTSEARYLPVSMLVCDVDYLKAVNDLRGHPAGDEVLVRAAAIVRSAVRSSDIVARIGGDEFAVILPNTDADAAAKVCERIRRRVEADDRLCTGLSVGVATRETMAVSMADLFKQADDAMYAGKRVCEPMLGRVAQPRAVRGVWGRGAAGRGRRVR